MEAPQGTYLSSPPKKKARQKKAKAAAPPSDDFDDEDDELHPNGYERDDFVVSDVSDDDEDDDDEHFGPLPNQGAAKAKSRNVGPPISHDLRLEELPEIHQDIVHHFVREAKEKEEALRNLQSLRRPLFSEKDFREMAIRWTRTLPQMRRIPGIDLDKVEQFGGKFLSLVRKFHAKYKEITGGDDGVDSEGGGNEPDTVRKKQQVVDLISSDMEFEDFDDEDAEELESSAYFNTSAAAANPPPRHNARPEVSEWSNAFTGMNQERRPPAIRPTAPASRGRGAARGGASGGGGGGGKRASSFARKGSGGFYKKAAGVSKRKGSTGSRRTSGGGASASTKSSSGSFFSKGGGKSGKGGRGGGGSGSIGLMPM